MVSVRVAVICLIGTSWMFGQNPVKVPTEFEVATIKPSAPQPMGSMRVGIGFQPGGRFTASSVTLKMLIAQAYNIKELQITGGPGWLDSDRWDITAKIDAADLEGKQLRPEEVRPLIQALLKDRFHLEFHQDTKEMSVYGLVVGKGGSKLTPVEVAPGPGQNRGVRMGNGSLNANAAPIQLLCDMLSRNLGRTVIDKTGLTGTFDFKLEWSPDEGQHRLGPGGGAPGADAPAAPESSGPSLINAVQEQLGLKLETEKGPVAIYTIDRAEKPVDN